MLCRAVCAVLCCASVLRAPCWHPISGYLQWMSGWLIATFPCWMDGWTAVGALAKYLLPLGNCIVLLDLVQ